MIFRKHIILILLSAFSLNVANIHAQVYVDSEFNTLLRAPNGGWIAGDATYSIALPDSRTLWLFGDSFIGTANPDSSIAPGAQMIRNCAILQDGDSMQAIYNGSFENPVDFVLTPKPDSSWFWPEHGMVENDTLKIFMSEFIEGEGVPGWNFEFNETYLVYFSYPGLELLGMDLLPYYQQNEVLYGNQVMQDGDYTYIYGRKDMSGNVPYVHLARAPQGNLMAAWEFYDGFGWSQDPTQTARLSFEGVSQQFAVFKHHEKYVMLTQQIWLGAEIYTLTSDHPEGPWKNKQHVYTTPHPFPDMFTYNAYAHPQFNEDNELLVSYNSNGDFWEIFNNVELYRPQFIRVPFAMIDTSFIQSAVPEIHSPQSPVTLLGNKPNPAGASTEIEYHMQERMFVSLKLYNSQGMEVGTYINQTKEAGRHSIRINLRNLSPGIYFYQIQNSTKALIHCVN